MNSLPSYSKYAEHWMLDRNTVFLNHGSFGGCPIPVLNKQTEYRNRMEQEPVKFMITELEDLLWKNKEQLAAFVGAKAKDLVFVPNATYGVNTVMNNLELKEGDEILTHNHAYGACWNAVQFYAEKSKAKLVIAEIPFPIKSEDDLVEAFMKGVTPKTKFAMIDHVTSATGIIFPVKKLTAALHERRIEVLIDGAHAPGMLDLNIDEIGAEYYTGNCHKWICSPKGSALLHVREDKQKNFRSLIVSHTYDKKVGEKLWSSHFFWPGTSDYTAYACIGDSIDFMGSVMGDWKTLRKHNHDLIVEGRKLLLNALGAEAPCPENMLGSLATVPLPIPFKAPETNFNYIHPFWQKLMNEYHIQTPVFGWSRTNPRWWLRIAGQAYNSIEQIQYLAEVLKKEFPQ